MEHGLFCGLSRALDAVKSVLDPEDLVNSIVYHWIVVC